MNEKTTSICPVCGMTVPALRTRHGDRIALIRTCPVHGRYEALIWEDGLDPSGALDWDTWHVDGVNTRPAIADTPAGAGCPHDCGLCPSHEQQACCVLIEITQRCDQHCRYCFASAGDTAPGDPSELSLGQIRGIYEGLLRRAPERPFNIQLSGGEPAVRDDLPEIVRMGRDLGFPYIQLNTNGKRLSEQPAFARSLAEAGLSSVFLQFDGTDDRIYDKIRGKALLETKEKAIRNCAEAGLGIVLVPTVVPGVNDGDLWNIVQYAVDRLPNVRGVHFQPVSYFGRFPRQPEDTDRITLPRLVRRLVDQSGGRLSERHFIPLMTGHAMCSFHGNFIALEDGSLTALSMDPKKAGCSCQERSIEKARDYISRKWRYEERKTGSGQGKDYDFSSWDLFLDRAYNRGLSITAMAFQDAWNLDLDRLRKCRVHIATADDRLIPFCAYNILHRPGCATGQDMKAEGFGK